VVNCPLVESGGFGGSGEKLTDGFQAVEPGGENGFRFAGHRQN
jgi:hypothetical protein